MNDVPVVVRVRQETMEWYWNKIPFVLAVLCDAQCVVVRTNLLFRQESGYEDATLMGRPLADIIIDCDLGAAAWETPASEHRVRLRTKDEELLEMELMAMPIEIGDTRHYLALLHQVGAIQQSGLMQQFALTLLRDESMGVILLHANFRVNAISPLACKVLGVAKEEVQGKSMDELFIHAPLEHQLLKQMIVEEQPVRNHPFRWSMDYEQRELLMDANLLRDRQGRLLGAYVTFKDVSNLRSLEEQVQRSDRLAMIGQIAAGTAHEIRNPLTAIKGFLQMFKNTMKEKGLNKEYGYTEIMLTEIDRINELVSEFLLLSKPKNITVDLIDPAAVMSEIMPIIQNEALLHGIVVDYRLPEVLPRIVADREMLKQVFLNIGKNGIEAMKEGGVLTISGGVEREQGLPRSVCIDIQDNGPGIEAGILDRIFDPFVTTKSTGTGLGLSVCQRIIHDMGGLIRISTGSGGSTFTVSIPCSIEEREALG
ncbi:PAS domain-containing sensor histidine kinase [Paenibacillus sp. 598K]|nr:PAS domain-containing sensor histidine kinase [Paenibacillus sp. 598K]